MIRLYFVEGPISPYIDDGFTVLDVLSPVRENIEKFNEVRRNGGGEIVTNAVYLLRGVNFDEKGEPQLWFVTDNSVECASSLTDRKLKPGVNFENLFLAGEFDKRAAVGYGLAGLSDSSPLSSVPCESENKRVVEFVSYDGKYPNLCSGTLTLRIDGKEEKFEGCLRSGGCCDFDTDTVEYGLWTVELPDEYADVAEKVTEIVNANVPFGCCGGCT